MSLTPLLLFDRYLIHLLGKSQKSIIESPLQLQNLEGGKKK